MPEYKPNEANDMSWSDDLGWCRKRENPRYSPMGPSDREYTSKDAGDIVWSDDLGWCRKDEHPFYREYKRGE